MAVPGHVPLTATAPLIQIYGHHSDHERPSETAVAPLPPLLSCLLGTEHERGERNTPVGADVVTKVHVTNHQSRCVHSLLHLYILRGRPDSAVWSWKTGTAAEAVSPGLGYLTPGPSAGALGGFPGGRGIGGQDMTAGGVA